MNYRGRDSFVRSTLRVIWKIESRSPLIPERFVIKSIFMAKSLFILSVLTHSFDQQVVQSSERLEIVRRQIGPNVPNRLFTQFAELAHNLLAFGGKLVLAMSPVLLRDGDPNQLFFE